MTEPGEQDALLEPLRIAIQMETEGRQLFLEAARRASGRHARTTFEFLAAEEDRHLERIRDFYASIEKQGKPDESYRPDQAAKRRLAEFNDGLARLRGDLKPTQSDVEAFRFAIRFENGAEDFYRRQIENNDNEHVCNFYRWLAAEEDIHGLVLESCLEFAEDPATWFLKHQGKSN
jgi:rubrerythrin